MRNGDGGSPMGVQKWPKTAKSLSIFFMLKNHRKSPLVIVFVGKVNSTDISILVMAAGGERSHMRGQ